LKKKLVVLMILMILLAFTALEEPLKVLAQNPNIGVYIGQVTPSTKTGPVGTSVNILGSIYSPNSSYQIFFGQTVVASGTSEGYYVDANFTVPELPKGDYALILRDVSININYTDQFTVLTGYSVNAVPSSIQEGNSIKLTVTVTGGEAGASYSANLAIQLPSPVSTEYTKTVQLGTVNAKGTASVDVTYPDSSFQPAGSLTNYVGTYIVYFNQSEAVAQNQFTVNFIDSSTYHRGQTVNIRATGYQPDQTATLTITYAKTSEILDTVTLTATAEGVITASWGVSSNAPIGDYLAKISADGSQKAIQDTQPFTIPGYTVKVQTTNLAGEVTPNVVVHALDQASGSVYNATSISNGIATLKLESGNHVLTGFWNGVNVGQTNITVSGDATFTLRCQLTNLRVTVKNTNEIVMPFVDLSMAYRYLTSGSGSLEGSITGQTDSSGSYVWGSVLPQATYMVNASLYNQVFNAGNNTFSDLPVQAISDVVIICPSESLKLNVVGYNQEAIPGARLELVELLNGLFYSSTTDTSGAVSFQVTFGMYRARVYKSNILINETNVPVFGQSQQRIRCTLYGIQVSVSVVDFFGHAISNANVMLNGPETEKLSSITQGDGKTTFNNIIGGKLQIVVYPSGAQGSYQAVTLTVNEPTTVQIKIDKYVAVGSMLIQTTSLFAIIVLSVAIVLFVLLELYVRRKAKRKSPS
jgi:hypothetical protein